MDVHVQVVASPQRINSHHRKQQQQIQPHSCRGDEHQAGEVVQQQQTPLQQAESLTGCNNCIGHVLAEVNETAGQMQLGLTTVLTRALCGTDVQCEPSGLATMS